MLCLNCKLTPRLLLLIFLFHMVGCAGKPWQSALEEELSQPILTQLQYQLEKRRGCPTTFDAEAIITIDTPLKDQAFTGFIQVLRPSHIKVVAINPLGQPLLAFIANEASFQSINTLKKEYTKGKLSSLALRLDLPPPLLKGNWADRLYGQLPPWAVEATVLQDANSKGFWLHSASLGQETGLHEYLLIDPQTYTITRTVFTDDNHRNIARIDYEGWTGTGECKQPGKLLISGLSSGVEVVIELRDIVVDNSFTRSDFSISPPPGYVQNLY